MAYFLRLIPAWGWFLVGCLLAGVPQLAFADDYSAKVQYGAGANRFDTLTLYGQYLCPPGATYTGAAVYTGVYEYGYGTSNHNPTYEQGEALYCQFQEGTGYGWSTGGGIQVFYTCPYGGTLSGTMCVSAPPCTAPNVRDPVTGQCVPPPDPCTENAGKWHSSGYGWRESKPWGPEAMSGTGEVPTTLCADNCAVTVTFDDVIRFPSKNTWSGVGYSQATGQSCQSTNPVPAAPTTGPTDPKTSPEYDCAKNGQSWGTVNGTVVCTGGTTDKETTKTDTSKTTNPDNTTSETQTTTQCQGTTCTETKTTTNCDASGNNCTTSTSTTEKTGTGEGGEGEGDEPESKWGGNCAGGFACSGDAIQCAISKEIHEQKCRQDTRDTESNTYLNQIAPTKDIAQAKVDEALNANGDFDFDVVEKWTEAQDSYVSFTASCLPDLYFDLKGQRYTFDVGFICGIADFVKLMMHLAAYMVLFRLLSKGFGG